MNYDDINGDYLGYRVSLSTLTAGKAMKNSDVQIKVQRITVAHNVQWDEKSNTLLKWHRRN